MNGNIVLDGDNNPVGNLELINGKPLAVLTTDANGEITENLLPGTYILTEVQAPDGYILPEKMEDRQNIIEISGIGDGSFYVEKESVKIYEDTTFNELLSMLEMQNIEIIDRHPTNDKGYIIAGCLTENANIDGYYTESGESINLTIEGEEERGINFIITPNNKIKSVLCIENSSENSYSNIEKTIRTNDNKYISIGHYAGKIYIPANYTKEGKEISLETSEEMAWFIIQYDENGKVESFNNVADIINQIESYDLRIIDNGSEIVLECYFDDESCTIPAEQTVDSKEIVLNNISGEIYININSEGKVINAYTFKYLEDMGFEINSVTPMPSKGVIVTGGAYNNIIFDKNQTTSGKEITLYDGLAIIKYNAEGKVEWANNIESNYLYFDLIKEVSNSYLCAVNYEGYLYIPAEYTKYGDEIYLESQNYEQVALIKYDAEGKVEWAINNDEGSQERYGGSYLYLAIGKTDHGYCIILDGYEEPGPVLLDAETYSRYSYEPPMLINYVEKENKIPTEQVVKNIENESIHYFDLEITKLDSDTKETIEGVDFSIEYTDKNLELKILPPPLPEEQALNNDYEDYGYPESFMNGMLSDHVNTYERKIKEKRTTDESGKIILQNLENERVYTLVEKSNTKGYINNKQEIRFAVHYKNGEYSVEVLKGNADDIIIEGNKIKINIYNDPNFKLIKQNKVGKLLAGSKFTITNNEGEEVKDGNGNLIGVIEEINGEPLRVITTKEDGTIKENLLPGTYILTEVQAPKGYKLPEDPEARKHTIEIAETGNIEVKDVIEPNINNLEEIFKDEKIYASSKNINEDGSFIISGGLNENVKIDEIYTESGEPIELNKSEGMCDAINIIANAEGKIKHIIQINGIGSNSASTTITSIKTKENKYIVLGMYTGTIEIPKEKTVDNQERTLTTEEYEDTFMAIYNEEGKLEQINSIVNISPLLLYGESSVTLQQNDTNTMITIDYVDEYEFIIPKDKTADSKQIELYYIYGPVVINLNEDGKVISAFINPEISIPYEVQVGYGIITKDGGVLIGGYINDTFEFDGSETANGENIVVDNYDDGILIKYDADGKVEWAKMLGAEQGGYGFVSEVTEGYIGVAYYQGNVIIPKQDTQSGNEIVVEAQTDSNNCMLIKYNEDGEVEWAKRIDDIDLNSEEGNYYFNIQETKEGFSLIVEKQENEISTYKIINYKENDNNSKEIVLTIDNEGNPTKVVVHHYIEGTNQRVPSNEDGQVVQDEEKTGFVGDIYTTEASPNINQYFEFASNGETEATGEMTEEQKEVIYYYRLKNVQVEQNELSKTATSKIIRENQEIDYTITYHGKVTEYIGNAKVTIVDTLPYKIDESSKEKIEGLENWTYSEEDGIPTLTYEKTIENINGTEEIDIEEQLELVFVEVNYGLKTIENKAKATLYLETAKSTHETEEAIAQTEIEITKDITVTKKWNHENNTYEIPDKVELQIKKHTEDGNEEIVATHTVTREDNLLQEPKALEKTEETWQYTFTGLPKYNEKGEEIEYFIGENEEADELKYYSASIDQNQNTITNTYNGPIISSNKKVTTQYGENYVLEGEIVTYTITVTNAGEEEKEVKVQDNIPAGTTFVEGSIQVNGESMYTSGGEEIDLRTYNAKNLSEGIMVTVPAKSLNTENGQITLSFKVSINQLEEDIFTKRITNTAKVDEKDTNEVEVLVNKTKVTYKKTSEPETGSKVVAGDIITYRIEAQNTGTAPANIKISDTVPKGTTYVEDSINIIQELIAYVKIYTIEELNEGISLRLQNGEKVVVEFKVKVNEYLKNGTTIRNVAEINGIPTNETEHIVEASNLEIESSITKSGTESIASSKQEVNYYIEYHAVVKDYIGESTLTVTDTLPYKIDEEKSELNGGKYDDNLQTITWIEDLGTINTVENGEKQIDFEKDIKVVFKNLDASQHKMTNYVKGRIEFAENDTKDEVEDSHITNIDIPAKVVVRYLEKETGEVLLPEKIIEGYVGDPYETTRETIENYRAAEPEPENSQGKMEENDNDEENTIYVTYYYEKIPSGKITVKYVDMDTGEEITYEEQREDGNSERKTYREEMQGYVGEKYVTEQKEIPYYKYLEDLKPTNGEGYYTEDDDTVMYYYRKLEFNISVEKNIVGASINGEPMSIRNNKLIKMEVVASKALTTKVEIEYEVIVKNTGELKGKAKVEENIPEGLKVSSKNPEYWKQENGKLTKEVELEAGGEEKLGVVLEWKNGNSNFGDMNNIVKVVSTENPANYLETTEEDNTSEAEAIISVKTGASEKLLTVILGTIASCGALVLLYEYETYQRERGVAIRHVVLDGQNVVIVKKKQGKKA